MISPDGATLYFMDNTMSFSTFEFGHERNVRALRRIQVFPRALVERLRALTEDAILAALGTGDDARARPAARRARSSARCSLRRDNMLRYIDQLIAEHGEDAVLALP